MLLAGLRPLDFLLLFAAFVVSISVHEFSHAWTAYKLGDPTARNIGRLTLNPLAHMDPLGTLALLFMPFGWGKPVPVNPYNLRSGPVSGMALVSFAGPFSNLVAATLFAIPIRFGSDAPQLLSTFLFLAVEINVVLAVFNLIPIPPLDGFRVLMGVLPRNVSYSLLHLEAQGPVLLVALIGLAYFGGPNVFGLIMRPVTHILIPLLLG